MYYVIFSLLKEETIANISLRKRFKATIVSVHQLTRKRRVEWRKWFS